VIFDIASISARAKSGDGEIFLCSWRWVAMTEFERQIDARKPLICNTFLE
jgi:hypothetical protein